MKLFKRKLSFSENKQKRVSRVEDPFEDEDKARFTDTSWQIHRTWTRNGDPISRSPAVTRAEPVKQSAVNSPDPRQEDQNGIYDTITVREKTRAVSAPATPAAPTLITEYGGPRSISYSGGGGPASRLDLCYVAERMLALHLPHRDAQAEAQAAHMLTNKHGEHFMVFEVSGGDVAGDGRAARGVFGRARSLGWPGDLAPPLERLCAACKHIESWLAAHPKNVAILLAWGNRERLGVLVAAYMHYSAICGAPEHALDRYAMRRYLDDRVPVFTLPSNKRYIDTFAGLLAGQIRVNSAPLQLTHVSVAGSLAASSAPTIAFLKIYENYSCVYTSGLYMVNGGGWTVGVGRLALRGDVLVRAYRRPAHQHAHASPRHLVFACQFHTCAVADHTLSFTKLQLDHALHDPSFPSDGAVELIFARGEGAGGAPPAPTPAAPLRAAPDALARADSLEHLRPLSTLTDDEPGDNNGSAGSGGEAGEAAHTFGPLDGSIYATVVRASGGPSSPLSASMDSGISSAGRRAAPSPPDELDALLGDMLRTVSALPDPPPAPTTPQSNVERAPDIPYHARTDSAPFTYGAPGLRPGMLRASNRLASPELVRRALGHDRGYQGIEDDDDERTITPDPSPRTPLSPRTLRKLTCEDVTTTKTSSTPAPASPLRNGRWTNGDAESIKGPQSSARKLSHDAEWIERPPSSTRKVINNDTWRSTSTIGWHESTRSREPRRSESGIDGNSGLTWLQRQQQKLRERKEARERVARLPLEWDAPSRHVRRSASHRVDGYTSDTTAFADDDDDFSVPLHVNTRTIHRTDSISPQAPDRTSSRKFMYEKMTLREWSASSTPTNTATPGLLSLAEPINNDSTIRERSESWSRAESRAGTPAFPTHPRTPYPPTPTPSLSARPPRSPPSIRKDREGSPESEYRTYNGSNGSRRSSLSGSELQHVAPDRVRFARDTSHYWYKPNISRDDAVSALLQQEEGAFIVRDSNSFPGAFGLAVRASGAGGVRHFLIEPTARGVRLRGCPDEPVFSSLSALVYQHTVTPLALPVPLKLPDRDLWTGGSANAAARALLATGAACNVLLLGSENTEALTGPAAVKRAVQNILLKKATAHVVHFKVFGGGITLTDSTRKVFFRRHYPSNAVSYAGIDPDERRYVYVDNGKQAEKRIFAFVARSASGADNQCHVFAELEPEQPATAIVNFVNKALLGNTQKRDII
ncbi:unnamed protein product [Leptosia nina]|uniref:Tensin n=1 Tax=Leptosia nina TaxID=320188 RepID=A0AAV1JM10_9NEOP